MQILVSDYKIHTMFMRPYSLAALLLFVCACSQQKPVDIVDNSGKVYARLGATNNGEPIARYSANNPARQSNVVAYKYGASGQQNYDVDAPLDKMSVKDLPPPTASNNSANIPSIPVTAQDNAQPFKVASQTPPLDTNIVSKNVAELPEISETTKQHASPASAAPIPLQWPVAGGIISRFGPKTNGLSNDGVNIAAKAGDPIWASADGEVIYVGNDLNGYGNLLILRHAAGWLSSYAHAQEFLLAKGTVVKQGDLLGYVGSTGSVKTPQLHFSLRQGKIPVDPESVIGKAKL